MVSIRGLTVTGVVSDTMRGTQVVQMRVKQKGAAPENDTVAVMVALPGLTNETLPEPLTLATLLLLLL